MGVISDAIQRYREMDDYHRGKVQFAIVGFIILILAVYLFLSSMQSFSDLLSSDTVKGVVDTVTP